MEPTIHDPVMCDERSNGSTAFLIDVDELPGPVWITDAKGHHLHCNRRVVEYTGKTSDDFRRELFCCAIHELDRDRVVTERFRCVAERKALEIEFRWRRHDGQYRWFRIQVHHVLGHDGQLLRSYNLLSDIHEQKLAERALVENETKFHEMIDKAPVFIWMADREGNIIFGNQSCVAYTGKTEAAWGGHGWNAFVHPDDAPGAWERWRACIATGSVYRSSYRLRRNDGAYRWFQSLAEPLRDESGEITRWIGVNSDVDDRVKAEDAFRETSEQLRLMVDTIPALVFCSTPDGTPAYFNKPMAEYTGLSGNNQQFTKSRALEGRDDPAGLRWRDIIHHEDRAAFLPAWEHSLATGIQFSAVLRLRRADGAYKWFQMLAEPLRDSSGRIVCWYGIDIDIDENKQTEELLRVTRSRLAKAAQIATVAELSATIAHEINQPLAAVVANADACTSWLAGPTPNLERARLAADSIANDGHAASVVLSRIRSLFQQSKAQKQTLNLNEVILELLRLTKDELTRKAVSVDLRLETLKPVFADKVQLQQVLTNLISNAVDAMQAISSLTKTIVVRSRMLEQAVIVSVSDAGPGVSAPDRVFESFFTSKETGLGMGLSICRTIIEAHGGTLWLQENSDRGATFAFSIPINK